MDEKIDRIMYKQYLSIKPAKNGYGVFTSIEIPAAVAILEVTGTIYAEQDVPDPTNPYLLQVGPNVFIGPSGTFDDFINHSCDPNCRVRISGNRAIIFSLYVIRAGMELTFDYSTTATDTLEKWQMNCNCGSVKCRKVISGFQYLPTSLQEEYKGKGMLPLYITSSILRKV
jgi:uncharacterized protein